MDSALTVGNTAAVEREPRAWLERPRTFGLAAEAELVERPDDPFERADRRAASLQNNQAYKAWERIHDLPRTPTLKVIAEHPAFPYTYDTLGKCLRGQQWMTIRVYAAILNTIEALADSYR